MSKPAYQQARQDVPVTQAVRTLRVKKIDFTPHFYAYEERGGTKLSSESLDVPEHNVIKTIVLETNEKKPLIVLMHGDFEISTKNLARFLRVKTISPCDPNTANKHTGYIKIYINGGKRGFLIEINPNDIRKALDVTEVNVAVKEN